MNTVVIRKRTTDSVPLTFTVSQTSLSGAFPTAGSVSVSPSGLTLGTVAVLADGVRAAASSGTSGVTYVVTASITLSDGRVVTEQQQVVVYNAAIADDVTLEVDSLTPDYYFTNIQSITDELGTRGITLLIDDDGTSTANTFERSFLLKKCKWATDFVWAFCNRYPMAQLALNECVRHWATIVAARDLAGRKGNSVPASLEQKYLETLDELKMIQMDQLTIPGIKQATEYGPGCSNLRIDPMYPVSQQRVVTQTSSNNKTRRKRKKDSSEWFPGNDEW